MLSSLNPQQRLAVETLNGPILILAGAGTGKTRVITCRIAHLIDRGVTPGHILAVTFTNKAAREMRERVERMLPNTRDRARASGGAAVTRPSATLSHPMGQRRGEGPAGFQASMRVPTEGGTPNAPRPTICTFHSLGVRLLRQHIDRLGYRKDFVIYNESEQLGAIKKILSHISARGEKTDPQAILGFLSRWKNGGTPPAAGDPGVARMAEHIRSRYQAALRACNALDFDDLLLHTLRLLTEHPDILAACRDRFRYVMVDEYQDTNAAQFRLVHLLAREHRNLCVVGDDDQSIYGWRGAQVANLLDLEKHFPEVKVITLEQNYRSTNVILRAANAVIKNNARRRGKQLWSQKGPGPKIVLHAFDTDEAEARSLVEQVDYGRLARRARWSDQAILFRTNLQSRALETALRQAGVRYRLVGGQSYFDRREVKDVIAYLKVLVNPHDDVSLLRIANVPARGLSDATMERLLAASHRRHCSVYAAMQHTDVQAALAAKPRAAVRSFVEFIERTRTALHSEHPVSLPSWAEHFLTATGYLDELRRSEKDPETGENRVRNLRDLVAGLDAGQAATPKPTERLQAFLEELTLDRERDSDDDAPGDTVTLITMHSCKGLEFPHVYVVGLEEGLLPHSRAKAEGTLEEERRLFYVAITRAQETLTLSYCLGRKKFGRVEPCHPSSFLRELPPELIERADEKSRRPVPAGAGKELFSAMRAAAE